MAEVNIDLNLRPGNVNQGLRQVQRSVTNTNTVVSQFLGNIAATAFISFANAATEAFGDIFRSAIQIEQVSAQFRVLTGDAEIAEQALREVSVFASTTPFENPEVERAATQLLGFGVTADELVGRLTDLGNVAGVSNRSIEELATIFGQINSVGRLTGERFNQLLEGGVNLTDALANQLGVASTEVAAQIMLGAVSADVFNRALSATGDRLGGIEVLSQTLGGQLSTLSSTFELLRRAVGSQATPALTELVMVINAALASIVPFVQALARIVIDRVVTFIRDFREELAAGTTTIQRITAFLSEHRGIIIRVLTAYALFRTGVLATRLALFAYGAATTAVTVVTGALRTGLLAARAALILGSQAFVALAGFLSTTFTAVIAVLLTPIGAIGAAILAVGVVIVGFRQRAAQALVEIGRFFVQLARNIVTQGQVIETILRVVASSILDIIGPAIQSVIGGITRLIRAVPSAFRPASLDRFANSLDNINLKRVSMGIREGRSALDGFGMSLDATDQRLGNLSEELGRQAEMTSFGNNLSEAFNSSIDSIQEAAAGSEFLRPVLDQVNSFRMSLSNLGDGGGIQSFVETGRNLLGSLKMALVDGEIPASLQNLLSGSVEQIQGTIATIEQEEAAAERRAAENRTANNEMKNAQATTQTAAEVAAEMKKNQQIAEIRLAAMEAIEIMEVEARIREIENRGLNNEEDILAISEQQQRIIDLRANFANLRAQNITDGGMREVAIEQTQANMTVAIAKRAQEEKERLGKLEMKNKEGVQQGIDGLIQAGLKSERLGARERAVLQVAQAVRNTYAGATRAFVDYPAPASFVVAAGVIANGLATVDNILSAGSFQGGGVVGGSSFSGDNLTAQVNSGELILNRAQQSNIAGELTQSGMNSDAMESRLAGIEALLSQPTVIQNANGAAFAEIVRDGIRDGVDIMG